MTEMLLNYGGVGILAIALTVAVRILFGQVAKDKQRETDRADRNEQALKELNEKMSSQMIPALVQNVTVLQEINKILPDLQDELRLGRRDRNG